MAKFEQTMAELGYTSETLSKGIQGLMKTYYKGLKEVESLEADLQNLGDDDETKADLQSSISSIREDLADVDRDLVKKIKSYHENKDFYDAKMQYMKDKAAGKEVEAPTKSNYKKPAAPAPQPQPQPAPVASTGTQTINLTSGTSANGFVNTTSSDSATKTEPISVVAEEVKDEPKKKGSGNWILWAGLGVIGLLVGVNVMRNRD